MRMGTCAFGEIANVGLGFKSLQNQFFYLTKSRVQQYGVEKQFLKPIFKLADFSSSVYLQKPTPSQWLFYCDESEKDLGGTGALKYIRQMKDLPATERKQSSLKRQTISEVLRAQSGGFWYGPKAIPHTSHIWLRKAFNTNFSPFIVEKAVALDQRCNYILPKAGLDWKLVAAVVTSSLFALSVESYGNATMGAGVLELATKKLPEIRVPDIRNLSEAERSQLASLVESVWKEQVPVEWTTAKQPSKALQQLDTFLLAAAGAEIPLGEIYADINDVVRSRILVARDKEKTTKSHQRVNIAAVAASIAESVKTLLESKRFPDDFYDGGGAGLMFDFSNSKSLEIECVPMLDQAVVDVRDGASGEVLLNEQYPRPLAQAIVRALLLGRRRFIAPSDSARAEEALANLDKWLPAILEQIEEGTRISAVGTRYEQQVFDACFRALKFDVRAATPQFYGQVRLE